MTRADVLDIPFAQLSPNRVALAIEALGFYLSMEPFALNSYENRVYLFQDDNRTRWVAKFYRPARWSIEAILEEHRFLAMADSAGVSVGLPWADAKGCTLHDVHGYRMAIFRHVSGRAPALDTPDDLFALGEAIGSLHAATRTLLLPERSVLSLSSMAEQARDMVLRYAPLTALQRNAYLRIVSALMAVFDDLIIPTDAYRALHGDCHIGNVLGDAEHGFTLVDFDDCMMGPAIQDLWMFLSGERGDERRRQLSELIEGYETAEVFDNRQLAFIEPLATLRIMRHAAWLIARWNDPAFPMAFPDIACEAFWDGHLRLLEGQLQALADTKLWA